jgi:hypothetical protein
MAATFEGKYKGLKSLKWRCIYAECKKGWFTSHKEVSPNVIKHQVMKTHGKVEVQLHAFLTSAHPRGSNSKVSGVYLIRLGRHRSRSVPAVKGQDIFSTCQEKRSKYLDLFYLPKCNSPQWAKTPSLSRIHVHTQLYTPQSVRLLWMSDRPDAETSTIQLTTLTRDKIPWPRRGPKPRFQPESGRRLFGS